MAKIMSSGSRMRKRYDPTMHTARQNSPDMPKRRTRAAVSEWRFPELSHGLLAPGFDDQRVELVDVVLGAARPAVAGEFAPARPLADGGLGDAGEHRGQPGGHRPAVLPRPPVGPAHSAPPIDGEPWPCRLPRSDSQCSGAHTCPDSQLT